MFPRIQYTSIFLRFSAAHGAYERSGTGSWEDLCTPKVVLLWNGAILLLPPCSGRSGLFGAWNGRRQTRQFQPPVAPNTAPIKDEDGWKERSCGKARFVTRNNPDGDRDSWFKKISRLSGLQMALPTVKKVGIQGRDGGVELAAHASSWQRPWPVLSFETALLSRILWRILPNFSRHLFQGAIPGSQLQHQEPSGH